MKQLYILLTIIIMANPVLAGDLGSHQTLEKSDAHVGQNRGTADGRQGGETIETAVPIPSIPFMDTGNTSDNTNNYEVSCPYVSTSPDVVYSYVPSGNHLLTVDLCGSGYDTKTYIYDEYGTVVACNDDYYFTPACGNYVSKIAFVSVVAGQTYYIVIDGYGGDSGDYNLVVSEEIIGHSCIVDCDGHMEDEPPLEDGYDDVYNGGCNDESGFYTFQTLAGDAAETLTFCGTSGWHTSSAGSDVRDTDWFLAEIGSQGFIEWTLDAEEEVSGYLLGPQDCSNLDILQALETSCEPNTMTITGIPGEVVWLWVGPTEYTPPAGFMGHEFNYICTFNGIGYDGTVATEAMTFEAVKCLYR